MRRSFLISLCAFLSQYFRGTAAGAWSSVFTLTPQPFLSCLLFVLKLLWIHGAVFHAYWFSVATKQRWTGRSVTKAVQAFHWGANAARWMNNGKKAQRGKKLLNNVETNLALWLKMMVLQKVFLCVSVCMQIHWPHCTYPRLQEHSVWCLSVAPRYYAHVAFPAHTA